MVVEQKQNNMYVLVLQKQEKPKFVLCVTFAENGDAITGDSSGNILVWGKGTQCSSQKVLVPVLKASCL